MSNLLAAFQATLMRSAPVVIGPVRRTVYDDGDPFFSYEGAWQSYTVTSQGPWACPLTNDRMSYARVVAPSTPLTQVTTAVFTVLGTAEEGLFLFGANEAAGEVRVWIRALDYAPNPAWTVFTQFGDGALTWAFRSDATDPTSSGSYIVEYKDADGNPQPTQSAFDRLNNVVLAFRNLPAGRYQLRLEKIENSDAPTDSEANKSFYFDGGLLASRT